MDNAHRLKHLEWLKAIQKSGRRVKTLEKTPPEVWRVSQVYWTAFQILSSRRGRIDGFPTPIPMTEIIAYCDLVGVFGPGARRDLLDILMPLDDLYVERARVKIQKEMDKQRREAERGRGR